MTDDFSVTGADSFLALSKALKAAGRGEMRKALAKGLRDGAKPLIPLTRAAARQQLPHAGGLADLVAGTPQRIQVRTGADTAGVRLVVGKRRSGARGADEGTIRHPVFGHSVYVDQSVAPGWFTDTASKNVHVVLPALEAAITDVIDQIVKGAR